jgi:hypothetical protein
MSRIDALMRWAYSKPAQACRALKAPLTVDATASSLNILWQLERGKSIWPSGRWGSGDHDIAGLLPWNGRPLHVDAAAA